MFRPNKYHNTDHEKDDRIDQVDDRVTYCIICRDVGVSCSIVLLKAGGG